MKIVVKIAKFARGVENEKKKHNNKDKREINSYDGDHPIYHDVYLYSHYVFIYALSHLLPIH